MSRRGHGEGSIYHRKDGQWVAVMGIENEPGGRRRKAFYAKSRREVQAKLAVALKAQSDGMPVAFERQTVATFLAKWLATARPTLRSRTYVRYEQYVRIHALPEIGAIPLARLGPRHLQALYASRLAAGQSPSSVAHLHAVLHRALSQAARWELVARNVAALVDAPRVARHEMTAFTPDQARHMLAAAAGNRLEALYVLAVTTGMRQGELLGLRWRHVDFQTGAIHVVATLQRAETGFRFEEPKTGRSRRQVLLTRTAVAALRRHRANQSSERLRAGASWNDLDLVFANEIGGPIDATSLLKRSFHPLLRDAGLPRIRFHDLRHTAASLLLGRGIHPKIVSEQLGHAQVAVTLDLYSHVTPTMQRDAADAIDAVLNP